MKGSIGKIGGQSKNIDMDKEGHFIRALENELLRLKSLKMQTELRIASCNKTLESYSLTFENSHGLKIRKQANEKTIERVKTQWPERVLELLSKEGVSFSVSRFMQLLPVEDKSGFTLSIDRLFRKDHLIRFNFKMNKTYFYGLPQWQSNGKILPEFIPLGDIPPGVKDTSPEGITIHKYEKRINHGN